MKNAVVDIVIMGGGVAGLWLLNRLRQQGYVVVLLESGTLGGGQTIKAQGIIHGGMKYALQGQLTAAMHAIATMPALWRQALAGEGHIDLSHVTVLSPHQYLWTTGGVTSKMAGFFASLSLKGQVEILTPDQYPPLFQHPQFKGQVYSLNEMVIDTHSLIRELAKLNQDVMFKVDPIQPEQLEIDAKGHLHSIQIQLSQAASMKLEAQKYIFAAGSGNEILVNKLGSNVINMQERPLHMVIVKHELPYEIYAHCLGLSAVPRITITTHRSHDNKWVWYLGGQLAEEGVKRDSKQQIKAARKELKTLFPWLDFSSAQFSSFMINRAEALQSDGKRPDACYFKEIENMTVVWPVKLAFAPLLANQVLHCLEQENISPIKSDIRELRAWPMPMLANPIWDDVFT